MVILVIGPNSSGKSRFIETEERFRGFTVINVYDYQKKTEAEKGLSPYDQLYKANELLKSDVVGLVRQHKDVVVEQTFFRALRRLDLLEAIREASQEVPIEIYVMTPSDEQLWRNCLTRADGDNTKATYDYERVKREMKEVFEFPNPAEGYSRIYAVSEHGISERRDAPDWERIRRAKEDLREEAEKWARKQEAAARHEKLVQDMEHMRFWHYCEVCGRKELLTADEAYQQGWDYPPRIYQFRNILTPRKCGNCGILDTISFQLLAGRKTFSDLTEQEQETLDRIKHEPESLLPSEDKLQ